MLIKRRDKIGQVYLTKINPIVDPQLDASGTLTFGNAATQYGFSSPPTGYRAAWFAFDNATGESRAVGETSAAQASMKAPAGLPTTAGAYVRVDLTRTTRSTPTWKQPVQAYSMRQARRVEARRAGASGHPPPPQK